MSDFGNKKRYLIKTINFGKSDNIARILIEKFTKNKGDREFSKFMRELVITYLKKDKRFEKYKIDLLIEKRKILKKKIEQIGKEIGENAEELKKLGLDLNKI